MIKRLKPHLVTLFTVHTISLCSQVMTGLERQVTEYHDREEEVNRLARESQVLTPPHIVSR
jgi:hypothetical protein